MFSTELSRSSAELVRNPNKLRRELQTLDAAIETARAAGAATALQKATKARAKLLDGLMKRSVATYGAINLRTDGKTALMAYKIEQRKKSKEWDLYRLEVRGGRLEFVP